VLVVILGDIKAVIVLHDGRFFALFPLSATHFCGEAYTFSGFRNLLDFSLRSE